MCPEVSGQLAKSRRDNRPHARILYDEFRGVRDGRKPADETWRRDFFLSRNRGEARARVSSVRWLLLRNRNHLVRRGRQRLGVVFPLAT